MLIRTFNVHVKRFSCAHSKVLEFWSLVLELSLNVLEFCSDKTLRTLFVHGVISGLTEVTDTDARTDGTSLEVGQPSVWTPRVLGRKSILLGSRSSSANHLSFFVLKNKMTVRMNRAVGSVVLKMKTRDLGSKISSTGKTWSISCRCETARQLAVGKERLQRRRSHSPFGRVLSDFNRYTKMLSRRILCQRQMKKYQQLATRGTTLLENHSLSARLSVSWQWTTTRRMIS